MTGMGVRGMITAAAATVWITKCIGSAQAGCSRKHGMKKTMQCIAHASVVGMSNKQSIPFQIRSDVAGNRSQISNKNNQENCCTIILSPAVVSSEAIF